MSNRNVARWETTGKDFIQLYACPDGTYGYSGLKMGGTLPRMKSDEDAIVFMESPWGTPGGAGPAFVLKCDRPSLKRVKETNHA